MAKEEILTANNVENIAQPREREKVFLQLYDWLLKSAYGSTRGSKEEAEDLVQDLYVRFVQSNAHLDLSDPKELRGYLFKALRNTSSTLSDGSKCWGLRMLAASLDERHRLCSLRTRALPIQL
jgi:hypothetical protein